LKRFPQSARLFARLLQYLRFTGIFVRRKNVATANAISAVAALAPYAPASAILEIINRYIAASFSRLLAKF
jgi:hypothetical protein